MQQLVDSADTGGQSVRLRDITSHQWKSGIAAWLGWLFDGLDMHLYTLVATPFVAQLLLRDQRADDVGWYSSIIQAAFLAGWALGGGFFGRIGDRIGRARALSLTVLTYAVFTGLSFFAEQWWHLFAFRFLAALGIGGEWAVGSALLSETWPRAWRPWIAAVLQSAVNIGIVLAMVAVYFLTAVQAGPMMERLSTWLFSWSGPTGYFDYRTVFLVGILPALLVFWIRRAVPEPEEWRTARAQATHDVPGVLDLFRGDVRRTTVLTLLVCALSLSAHWAFMYWFLQQLRNLPELLSWTDDERTQLLTKAMILLMAASVVGNFVAGAVARRFAYRRTIALMCVAYFGCMFGAYLTPRPYQTLLGWYAMIGICQGLFGLFTMYLPPLFPTLLRTTGAGFCYNTGRLAAALATVFFGLFSTLGDHRHALLYASFLFLPAAVIALALPEPPDEA